MSETEWLGLSECRCSPLCAWCRFALQMREYAIDEAIRNMTDEEWTKIMVWAMDFESRAIILPDGEPFPLEP